MAKDFDKKSQHSRVKVQFTDDIIAKICLIISSSKYGLHRVCKENPDLPSVSSILRELASNQEFRIQYAHAREAQAGYILDEAYDILDETSGDDILTEFGKIPNNEWINRSKARADFRKWMASRLAPKVYGDKLETESTQSETYQPPQINVTITNEAIDKLNQK